MSDFFRFPHTPHLAWMGEGSPRDDKVMTPSEVRDLLSGKVVVEEKLDGANLGFSLGTDGTVRMQNRGHYLRPPFQGQFARLDAWLTHHEEALFDGLGEHLILFGEWCAARHSLAYDKLPDWLLVFDVYDRIAKRFWSTPRRNELASRIRLGTVPALDEGHTTMPKLKTLVESGASHYRRGPLEGVVIRAENPEWLEARAKLVRPDFIQHMGDHWRSRALVWNQLAC